MGRDSARDRADLAPTALRMDRGSDLVRSVHGPREHQSVCRRSVVRGLTPQTPLALAPSLPRRPEPPRAIRQCRLPKS